MTPDDPATATLAAIRAIEQAATPGPWHLEWDSCDCGDGYGCSHGSWPHAIRNSRPDTEPRQDGKQRDWDYKHTEISELGDADAEFIATARTAMPRLLAAVEAVLAQHQPGRVAIVGVLCKRHEAHRHFSIDAREAADVRSCPDCAAMVYRSCTGCATGVSVDACPVREAIRAALTGTGKEGSDE